jgi:hypothetical protein
VAGDLLKVEGWYFIHDSKVCVDFVVTWRYPKEGVSGAYRPGEGGFDAASEFGPVQRRPALPAAVRTRVPRRGLRWGGRTPDDAWRTQRMLSTRGGVSRL